MTDLDAVSDRDFDAPSGLLDAQRRRASRTGLSRSSERDWADSESWLEPADVWLRGLRLPEAIEPLANCIAHHLAEGGVVYAFSQKGTGRAKYARSSQRPRGGFGCRAARGDGASSCTASGVYDVVLHTAGRVIDDTTDAVRRSVLGATALAFAPRAHAVEADPRTDIKARADYVEKEAQDQGFRTSRVNVLKVEPGPAAATGCMRSRDADVVEIDYVASVVDGGVFDRRSRFAAMLGSGEVLKGLELGLYDMCIGERRVLRVPPGSRFGDAWSRASAAGRRHARIRRHAARHQPPARSRGPEGDLDFELPEPYQLHMALLRSTPVAAVQGM